MWNIYFYNKKNSALSRNAIFYNILNEKKRLIHFMFNKKNFKNKKKEVSATDIACNVTFKY